MLAPLSLAGRGVGGEGGSYTLTRPANNTCIKPLFCRFNADSLRPNPSISASQACSTAGVECFAFVGYLASGEWTLP